MTRLIQISDCHLFADLAQISHLVFPYQTLGKTLHLASRHKPDAILVTGDISADDTRQSYMHFQQLMGEICDGIPWRVIPGNHDNNAEFMAVLSDHCLQADGPWKINNVSVWGLDTRWQHTQGLLQQRELEEVARQLATSSGSANIIAMHHPPYELSGWMKAHEMRNYAYFADWIRVVADVDMVIHGHLHADVKTEIAKVPVIGAPSTCWQFTLSKDFAIEAKSAGLRIIDITPEGKLSTSVVRIAV